jgi:hypothetical protein
MRHNRYGIGMLLFLVFTLTFSAHGQSLSVDFRQAANNDQPYTLGNVHWINSVLQRSNSVYYEGMSVPQRIMFMNIRATSGNQHALTFDHLAGKSGKHAYDYLTSHEQALDAASAIAPTALVDLNACGAHIGPPVAMQNTCTSLRTNGFSYVVEIPDVMGSVHGRSIDASIEGYETRFGNRTLRIYGNAPITSATLVFNGHTTGTNVYAPYTLQWTSASTSILIEMAAHLAVGADAHSTGTGVGYGSGLGAGSISGAPYHFRLHQLDGNALGNRDNQIMSAAVLANILCSASGPSPVCAGTQNVYSYIGTASNRSFTWSITDNTSNASIVGPATGSSVLVNAGNGGGSYTVNASISDGVQTVRCAVPVQINAPTVTVTSTPVLCGTGVSTVTVSASGGTPPYIGTGTFQLTPGTHNLAVSDANGCTTTTSVTITAPPAMAVTAAVSALSCTGGDADIIVSATGGTPPYSGTGSFQRGAGTHTFTVTDANGCSASTSITVTQPAALTASASSTGILCNGTNAAVTVTATGGTPPYSGTGTFQRGPGTWTFTVTDARNCQSVATVTITAPPSLSASAVAAPLLCNGTATTVTVSATGGTPSYTGTGTFTRGAGTHTFTVTDANNCSTQTTVTITEPPALQTNASATPINCNGGSSTVTVSASGGTPPYVGIGIFQRGAGTHIFTVTDANNCTSQVSLTITEPPALTAAASATPLTCNSTATTTTVTVTAAGGTAPYTGTGTFTRSIGTHSFTVTDANGCTVATSVTVTPAPTISVTATAPPLLCNGGTTTVTVTAAGGTAPYTGTGTFQRIAGTYTFSVTDANGCGGQASITIVAPPAVAATATAAPLLCNGGSTVVTVSATGGTAPYTGTGSFLRGAGTHTFIVTDANGCVDTVSVTLYAPPAVTALASGTPVLCHGDQSTITVTASGGTPPYYGTGTFHYGAGTHRFIVIDANNCADTVSITIIEPPALIALATSTPILCNGGESTVTVTANGGTPPYTGTGSFQRGPGPHTFTVTDAHGCPTQASILITEPAELVATATAASVPCNGGTTTVTISATGGTAPYTGTGNFQRAAGTHTFIITDANGCADTVSVTIIQPPAVTALVSGTPILCYGDESTITVSASGGTPPYYGTGVFQRRAGTHWFIVIDANGCADTVSLTIIEPPALIALASATPILCNGGESTVTVTANGGTPPYNGTGDFQRGPGTHTFTVTDAHGCPAQASILITEPPVLVATATAAPLLCNGGTTTVTVGASGGTPTYTGTGTFLRGAGTHTFIVTDANGCADTVSVTITEPPALAAAASFTPLLCNGDQSTITVSASGGTPPYSGTGVFQRGAGTHVFTVSDANGCTAQTTVTITEPPAIVALASATPILCNGDLSNGNISATGGTPPYTGTGPFSRPAGTYTFTVTDANGCTAQVSITITEPPALSADAYATPILCNGDLSTITVTASGGTAPYTGIGTFTRGPGTWSFIVTDANGCTDNASVTITEPPALAAMAMAANLICNGDFTTVTVTASGGTPPYSGIGMFTRPAGTHTFVVTDANGCSAIASVTITEPPALVVTASAPPLTCGNNLTVVTVTASGGTPPYTGIGTYLHHTGTYTFTVTDANRCTASAQVTVLGPPPLLAYATATPILCNGGNSTVTVTASGGTPPYSGTGTFLRRAGIHRFIVVDSANCEDTVTIVITEPPALMAVCSITPACVNGVRTASATVTGGTPPYSYYWMPGGITTTTLDVPCNFVGKVTLYVRDANWDPTDPNNSGCEASCTLNLANFAPDDSSSSEPPSIATTRDGDPGSGTTLNDMTQAAPADGGMTAARVTKAPQSTQQYSLLENYPNPFNPTTTIRYRLPEESYVRLSVFNTLGQLVTVLVDATLPAGMHSVTWNTSGDQGVLLPSGRYIYRMHAVSMTSDNVYTAERLMLLLK